MQFSLFIASSSSATNILPIFCLPNILYSFSITQLIIRSADTSNEKVKNGKIADTLRPITPLEYDDKVRVTGLGLENMTPGGFILTTMGGSNGVFAKKGVTENAN